ncbi:deoxynucleoside monophosphate kinase [Escherichia phage vB_EcoM_JS09]|uniref:Deoxynucleoside monophosphate kinase n=1 Tax=Escherichia phage vB_EcoM_JS09 TaxID=1430444 RepID=A0A060BME6_9CAUD|nr:deoxynucleoside monophosphate kinase [Escherichia phage vB_EcoM_JS09]AIA79993.1 deoxynucleoside monophosphate kinase [Escherichia phage vB_EcoM_JS09]
MELIFLSGIKRSGKDTTADYINSNFKSVKYQLAYPIKDALAIAWGRRHAENPDVFTELKYEYFEGIGYDRETPLNLNKLDVIELLEEALIYLQSHYLPINNVKVLSSLEGGYSYLDIKPYEALREAINNINDTWSIRRLMQALGTDVVVNLFDRMYWVKLFALNYMDYIGSDFDYYVVTDTRQVHEMETARAMGATVIHVVRSGTESTDKHITEAGLPIEEGDLVITNDGSLEELYSKIETILR